MLVEWIVQHSQEDYISSSPLKHLNMVAEFAKDHCGDTATIPTRVSASHVIRYG